MGQRWLVLGSALLLAHPAWADARTHKIDTLLAAEARDLARGDLRGAERRLARALADARPDARVIVAYAALVLPLSPARYDRGANLDKHTERATFVLAKIAKSEPTDDPVAQRHLLLYAAWAAALTGHYQDSLAAVREGGRLQDDATVACLRAIALVASRRDALDVAEAALAMARQYLPQDARVMGELGAVLLARGRADAAVAPLAERLAIAPSDLGARRDLSYALAAAGRPEEGLRLLLAVRDRCERERPCTLEAARIALEAGQSGAAVTLALVRLAAAPDDLDALYLGADGHTQRGEFDAARALLERVLKLRPESARAKQALAQLPPPSNATPR